MPYARTTAGATRPQRQRKDKDGDAHGAHCKIADRRRVIASMIFGKTSLFYRRLVEG